MRTLKVKIAYADVNSPYYPMNPVKEGAWVSSDKYGPFGNAPTGLLTLSGNLVNGKFNMQLPQYNDKGEFSGEKDISIPVCNVQPMNNNKGLTVGFYSIGKERIWIYNMSKATGSSTTEDIQLFLNEILKAQGKKPVKVVPVVLKPKDEKSTNSYPSLAFAGVA